MAMTGRGKVREMLKEEKTKGRKEDFLALKHRIRLQLRCLCDELYDTLTNAVCQIFLYTRESEREKEKKGVGGLGVNEGGGVWVM